MKGSGKKDSTKKRAPEPILSISALKQKRARLAFEIALGKTRDTAELASIRREIARRITEVNSQQKIMKTKTLTAHL